MSHYRQRRTRGRMRRLRALDRIQRERRNKSRGRTRAFVTAKVWATKQTRRARSRKRKQRADL